MLQALMENVTLGAHKPQAVSDGFNPYYLGTMSAFGYIETVA